MGVINMAHGEMVMIGAYTTFVVQEAIRTRWPGLFGASLFIAIPLAFLVSGAIGVYHAGVEAKIFEGFTQCTVLSRSSSTAELLKQITHAPLVRCDEVQFRFLGLSLAAWNAILSLGGAALIVALTFRGNRA